MPNVSADLVNQLDEERVAEYRARLIECFSNVRCTMQKAWQMGGVHGHSFEVSQSYMRDNAFYHIGNLPPKTAIVDTEDRLCNEMWTLSQKLADMVAMFTRAPEVFFFLMNIYI